MPSGLLRVVTTTRTTTCLSWNKGAATTATTHYQNILMIGSVKRIYDCLPLHVRPDGMCNWRIDLWYMPYSVPLASHPFCVRRDPFLLKKVFTNQTTRITATYNKTR